MNKEYEYFINVHINKSKYMRSLQNMNSYFDFSQELLWSITWQLTKRHLTAHVWTGTLLWGYSVCKEPSLSLHTVWPLYNDWVSGVFISCTETWGVQNIASSRSDSSTTIQIWFPVTFGFSKAKITDEMLWMRLRRTW